MIHSLRRAPRCPPLPPGSGPEARIAPFPAAALPADPAERFAALFAVRPRWQWIDLEPYLAGLKVGAEVLGPGGAAGLRHTVSHPVYRTAPDTPTLPPQTRALGRQRTGSHPFIHLRNLESLTTLWLTQPPITPRPYLPRFPAAPWRRC